MQDFLDAGATPPVALAQLAAAGGQRDHGKNTARDAQRMFDRLAQGNPAVPDLYEFDITVLRKAGLAHACVEKLALVISPAS